LKDEIEKQLDDIEEDMQKPFGNTKSVILSHYYILLYNNFLLLLLLDIFNVL
jgi:hypothetical protein